MIKKAIMSYTNKQIRQFRAILRAKNELTSTECFLWHLFSIRRILHGQVYFSRRQIVRWSGISKTTLQYAFAHMNHNFIESEHIRVTGQFYMEVHQGIHDILLDQDVIQEAKKRLGLLRLYPIWLWCLVHGHGELNTKEWAQTFGVPHKTFNHWLWRLSNAGLIHCKRTQRFRKIDYIYGLDFGQCPSNRKYRTRCRRFLGLDEHIQYAQNNNIRSSHQWRVLASDGNLPTGILAAPWSKFSGNCAPQFFDQVWGDERGVA